MFLPGRGASGPAGVRLMVPSSGVPPGALEVGRTSDRVEGPGARRRRSQTGIEATPGSRGPGVAGTDAPLLRGKVPQTHGALAGGGTLGPRRTWGSRLVPTRSSRLSRPRPPESPVPPHSGPPPLPRTPPTPQPPHLDPSRMTGTKVYGHFKCPWREGWSSLIPGGNHCFAKLFSMRHHCFQIYLLNRPKPMTMSRKTS